jgi:Putative Flp pilus-assembly TadE/G-like
MLKGTPVMTRPIGQAGQVIPLVALSMTVLLSFSGMAVDNGYWQYQQRQQQTAADSAAIGGAQALAVAGCPNSSSAKTAADNDASGNGYASNDVLVSNPPASGPYAGNNCAVSVTINATHATFFTRALGRPDMPVSTTATAQVVGSNPDTYVGLSGTTTIGGGTTISAPGGGIYTNGTFNCTGSVTINAGAIGYAGSAPTCTGATFSGATPAPSIPVKNPCPEIAGCNYLTNNPPPITNCQTLQANMNPTIQPGCYNGLTMGSCGTVTLEPGVYVLNGTSDFSGSDFVGTGVTFYVTANGTPPDFSTANSATISPPTTGDYANVLYYQVPANTGAPNFAGSTVHWKGLLYAPSATGVNFNGAKGDYTVVIVGSANLNDPTGYTFGTPPAGSTLPKSVILGQ